MADIGDEAGEQILLLESSDYCGEGLAMPNDTYVCTKDFSLCLTDDHLKPIPGTEFGIAVIKKSLWYLEDIVDGVYHLRSVKAAYKGYKHYGYMDIWVTVEDGFFDKHFMRAGE